MIQKRRALLTALIAGGTAVPAGAGCLDWLFHKHHAPVQPYAAALVPATTITPLGPPVAVGAPTITVQPQMQSAFGAVSDMTPVVQPVLAPGPYAANFGAMRPTAAAQIPAYGMTQAINNPSVLTGMPVMPGAPSLPGTAFRAPATATAFYGGAAIPQTSYNAAAAFQGQVPATSLGQPLYAQPQAPITSPGSGFLGRVFGNSYETNYNEIPTTVFRPVQQIDPATGQTVIVQQPCTTTTQQVQRTPYSSLQPTQPAIAAPYYGEPTCGNEFLQGQYAPQQQAMPQQAMPQQFAPEQSVPQPYLPPAQFGPQSSYPPQGTSSGAYGPIGSGVSQATALAPSYGMPQSFNQSAPAAMPSTAPLQGYPGGYSNGLNQSGDATQVQQPRLESARPVLTPPVTSTHPYPADPWQQSQTAFPSHTGAGYRSSESNTGNHQAAHQPSTAQPYAGQPYAGQPTWSSPSTTASENPTKQYSNLPPIPAAHEYRPPAWQNHPGGAGATTAEPAHTPAQQRPLSPPSLNDRTVSTQLQAPDQRYEQSARYASSQQDFERREIDQRHTAKPVAEATRDDSGWFAITP
jgi:hypothetical protein